MLITNLDLIRVCDQFLNGAIGKKEVVDFAWLAISSNDYEFDEESVVAKTIYEWDDEAGNYSINKANIRLWKRRLAKA